MIKVKEIIVVEGKYDKIRLSQIVDGTVITTEGFKIFKDKKKQNLLREVAKKRGVILFTDSDKAGFKIRNFIKNILGNESVKNAYIPEIKGKEKRKEKPSAEGFLGVEGVKDEIILKALQNVATVTDGYKNSITKMDFYNDGLMGGENSSFKRKILAQKTGMPLNISTNAMIDYINIICSYDEYKEIIKSIEKN